MKTTILAIALASIGIPHQTFAEDAPPPSAGQASHAEVPSTVPTKRSEKDFIGAADPENSWPGRTGLLFSSLGYDAAVVSPPAGLRGEGCMDTVIIAGDRLLVRLANARPLMFSPQGDYLILADAIDDDGGHNFIVDVLGLDRREVPLQRHIFGTSRTRDPRWSKDGQVIRAGDFNSGPDFRYDTPLAEILGQDAMNRSAGANRPSKEVAELTRQALLNQIAAITKQMDEAKDASSWRDGIELNMVRDKKREWLNELNRQLAWTNRQLAAIERYEASYRIFMENIRLKKRMFNDTTDGISDEELEILNQKKESANWTITDSRLGRITAKSKNAESVVSVQRYPIQSGSESEIAVFEFIHTTNLQAVRTTGMRLSSELADSFPEEPAVSINDFFAEGDKVANPEKYRGNVVTLLRPDGTLSYDISTKMEKELAKKRKAYDITALWDGRGFRMFKNPLQEPGKD
jgi:hypothetical protein